jgi:hypothetical protein
VVSVREKFGAETVGSGPPNPDMDERSPWLAQVDSHRSLNRVIIIIRVQ